MSLLIDLKRLPEDGLSLEGQLPVSTFDLDTADSAKAISPLSYSLMVQKDDEGLILTGDMSATFELQCGRCAESFPLRVELSPYVQDIELENDSPFDLTSTLREDILLALPNYPRCEAGNVSPRECPAEGRFENHQEPLPEESGQPGGNVWEALDQFKQPKQH